MATTIREELENAGFVWRATPRDDDALPSGAHPTFCVRVPIGQRAALLEGDSDISHESDESPLPAATGSRTRRLLSRLVQADLLACWHAFLGSDGLLYVHLRFAESRQARRFFRWIDWQASTIPVSVRRAEHTFFGD